MLSYADSLAVWSRNHPDGPGFDAAIGYIPGERGASIWDANNPGGANGSEASIRALYPVAVARGYAGSLDDYLTQFADAANRYGQYGDASYSYAARTGSYWQALSDKEKLAVAGLGFTIADADREYAARVRASDQWKAAHPESEGPGFFQAALMIGGFIAGGASLIGGLETVGVFGGEAAVETAVTTDAFSIGEVVTQSVAGGADVSTGAATMNFDEFGNIVNADGSLSDPGGNWDISTDRYNTAVEIYNAGSASSKVALDDIFGTVTKFAKSVGSIFSASRTALDTATRPAPNLTRTAGQMNLGMPLIALAGYFLLRG